MTKDIDMTEKEKMGLQVWYNPNVDAELVQEREQTDLKYWKFNMAKPHSKEQESALRELIGDQADHVSILAPVYFDYGRNVKFGMDCDVNRGCYFMDGAEITFGDKCYIGPFSGFYTANHPLELKHRNIGFEKALPIHVGNNCWFGANVTVMPGVTIGNGCVVAAGAVVTKDIPDNCLAAGVPARVIREIDQEKELK